MLLRRRAPRKAQRGHQRSAERPEAGIIGAVPTISQLDS
jgi:hypothetical protein